MIVTNVSSGVPISIATAASDTEYFRIPTVAAQSRVTVTVTTATSSFTWSISKGWAGAYNQYSYYWATNVGGTANVASTLTLGDDPLDPMSHYAVFPNGLARPTTLNVTIEALPTPVYPALASQSFSVFEFSSNATAAGVSIVSPVGQYVADALDGVYAMQLAPSFSSSPVKVYAATSHNLLRYRHSPFSIVALCHHTRRR